MTNGAPNPIVEENRKAGNSYEEWGIDGIGALENQGFATDISVNHGESVHFKIQTNATQYRLESDHATAVSYDRPFHTRRNDDPSGSPRSWVFYSEYPMLRWLEANGYDVSYFTCVDNDGNVNAIDGKALFAIRVPSEYGRLRFWANTAVATLPPGQALELGQQTLGYEGNKYSDEGNRPDGLFPLSENDFKFDGSVWHYELCSSGGMSAGEFRHSLTLYRHQVSQALVFGAHSATWPWGLGWPT